MLQEQFIRLNAALTFARSEYVGSQYEMTKRMGEMASNQFQQLETALLYSFFFEVFTKLVHFNPDEHRFDYYCGIGKPHVTTFLFTNSHVQEFQKITPPSTLQFFPLKPTAKCCQILFKRKPGLVRKNIFGGE